MNNLFIAYLSLFAISCFFLIKSGEWTVRGLTRIARFLQWKEFVVAFILMAFTTTLPELFVGITSAINNVPELSLSNIIGSNVINLTLILGWLAIWSRGFKIHDGTIIRQDSIYLIFISLFPFVLMADKNLSRLDGAILLALLFFYLYKIIGQEKKHKQLMPNSIPFKIFIRDLFIFIGSVALLILSAQGVTYSAVSLAKLNGLSLTLIGLIFVALGTNLPELIFASKAVALNRPQLSLGDVMGAVIVNSTSILGITVLIKPIHLDSLAPYALGIPFYLLAVILFNIFLRTKNEFSKWEGIVLILVYLIFIGLLFYQNTIL